MITLSQPAQINSVLGGNAPVGYDKLVIGPFTMNPVDQAVNGSLRLTASSSPDMQPITGSLRISVPSAELVVEVPQLDYYRRIRTSSANNTAILGIIGNAQNALEGGLIALGLIAGTQSAGV